MARSKTWDRGSFVECGDYSDDDLPTGWGAPSPPATPRALNESAAAASPDAPVKLSARGSVEASTSASHEVATTLAAHRPCLFGVSASVRSRKPLPSLFTNIPITIVKDNGESSNSGGRPPRPPPTALPFSIVEDERPKPLMKTKCVPAKTRSCSQERVQTCIENESPESSAALDEKSTEYQVRMTLELLRARKRFVSPEETLEALDQLQSMQRQFKCPKLPPLAPGRGALRSAFVDARDCASKELPRRANSARFLKLRRNDSQGDPSLNNALSGVACGTRRRTRSAPIETRCTERADSIHR